MQESYEDWSISSAPKQHLASLWMISVKKSIHVSWGQQTWKDWLMMAATQQHHALLNWILSSFPRVFSKFKSRAKMKNGRVKTTRLLLILPDFCQWQQASLHAQEVVVASIVARAGQSSARLRLRRTNFQKCINEEQGMMKKERHGAASFWMILKRRCLLLAYLKKTMPSSCLPQEDDAFF